MQDAYYEDFKRLRERLPGRRAPWLKQLREQALERFMGHGFPTTREEAWKYTDVRPIAKRRLRVPETTPDLPEAVMRPHLLGDAQAWRIVFLDGRFAPALSQLEGLPDGVTLRCFAAALEEEPAVLEAFLGHYADTERHPFVALNTAFMDDGVFLRLRDGVQLEKPLQILYVSSGTEDTVSHVRNLFVADRHSRALVVESYVGVGEGPYLTNAVTEVVTAADATVEHYKLQQESTRGFHVAGVYAYQERDSRYLSHNVSLGARLSRTDIGVQLDEEGAHCTLNGLYLGSGRQHIDTHTRIDHLKPDCTSHEWYKGVLDGHSRGVFDGRVVVHPDAQHTDAQQANNNLLLSRDAEADSKPQLEIYADDVKCSHGSTVGQLDETALFYLRSRAIDEPTARSILVYAFASDILKGMHLVPVRSRLEEQVAQHLLGGRSLEELV